MELKDFKIGGKFFGAAGYEWLCTDVGTRTITAIMLNPDKGSEWFVGPPYSLEEVVFDEEKMRICYTNERDMLKERMDRSFNGVHPGYLAEDMIKMFKEKDRSYPRKSLLRFDRLGENGEIWHPYAALKKEDKWFVKVFEIFSREFSEFDEDEFVLFQLTKEDDLKKRKDMVKSNVK